MTVRAERVSRVTFYWGASMMLLFIAWAQIAPYAAAEPEWWNPAVGEAAGLGVSLLGISVALSVINLLADVFAPTIRRLFSDE